MTRACILCNGPAVKRFTWVNGDGSGVGGGLQGGAMCERDMQLMWDALDRFPVAKSSVTIWSLGETP